MEQEEEENICDGVIYSDLRRSWSALSVSTQGDYLWGISGNPPPHRVGGFLSGALFSAHPVKCLVWFDLLSDIQAKPGQ